MFGLKAARDAMNVSGSAPDLMLVFTGSSRDKLAHLVMNSRMPFYGSQVTPFPLLRPQLHRRIHQKRESGASRGQSVRAGGYLRKPS
ncbi:hypothetical protein ACTMU2_04585 [Cupriavidus basilensis]